MKTLLQLFLESEDLEDLKDQIINNVKDSNNKKILKKFNKY